MLRLLPAALVLVGSASATAELAWRKLPSSPINTFRHDDVFFVRPGLGWVVNTNGYIYRTADGGETWTTLLHQGGSTFRCVGFVSETEGWVGNLTINVGCFGIPGDSTLLYHTTDGGSTWSGVTNIPEPLPAGLCGMSVVREDVVWISGRVCDTPRVVRTTDRGVSWTTFDLSAHADRLIDCRFPGDDVGFVVGGRNDAISGQSRGVILFTDDGGATWSDVHVTSVENAWCWKISFPSATTGYVSVQVNGPGPVFLKTTDGGASWTEKPFPQGTYFEQGIGFATETTGWIGGDANTWETTDGGDTWSPVDIGSPANDDNVNRFRFLSPTLGYAVGRKVYKYSDDAVVAVPTPGAEPHEPVLLVASRPNPFRSHSEIEFDVPVAGPVRLSVYDVLGRERLVLVDGWREEGRQVARLEGGTLPGSVYVLRLETAGGADHRKVQRIR